MKKNLGSLERFIRPLLAVIFLVLYFTEAVTGVFGIILVILAVVFLVTGSIGFCPIYHGLGWSSLPKSAEKPARI